MTSYLKLMGAQKKVVYKNRLPFFFWLLSEIAQILFIIQGFFGFVLYFLLGSF